MQWSLCSSYEVRTPVDFFYGSSIFKSFAETCQHVRVPGGYVAPDYNDVMMSALASQITSSTIVYSTVYLRRRSKKTSKLRVIGLCEGNSPVTGEFHTQRASNAENASIWWHHHEQWLPSNRPVYTHTATESSRAITVQCDRSGYGHYCTPEVSSCWVSREYKHPKRTLWNNKDNANDNNENNADKIMILEQFHNSVD